jgi:hypothetical protein
MFHVVGFLTGVILIDSAKSRNFCSAGEGCSAYERDAGFALDVHGALDGGEVTVSIFEGVGARFYEEVYDGERVGVCG